MDAIQACSAMIVYPEGALEFAEQIKASATGFTIG